VAGTAPTGETGVGKARRKAETAYRTAVCVGVFGVRRGSDEGAAVVGLGETRVALYPSSFECPAFMSKKLCL